MASMNFSLAAAVLLSGLVILGSTTERAEAVCTAMCVQGVYMTCRNYKGNLTQCACHCKPANGLGCVIYSANGTALQRC